MPVTTVGVNARQQGPEPAPDGRWSRASTLLVRAIPLVQAALTVLGGIAVIAFFGMGPQGLPLPLFAVALAVPLLFAIAAGVSAL